ncbi:MAG: AtpZ/AtpI family protein [Bacteroidetes bacterium]|nr:AtpZ/AtpI family protein [Bacteroidota bacterium]
MTEPDKADHKSGETGNWRSDIGPFLTMGMELAFAVVGMFFIGRWIDSWLDIAPWGMFGGLILGVVGGFIRFFRRAMSMGTGGQAKRGG